MRGTKVRELRKQLRLTQEQLAQKVRDAGVNFTRERLSQIELSEDTRVTGESLYGLAQALGVHPNVLLEREVPEPEAVVAIPVVGFVPSGTPFPSDEFRQGFIDLPAKLLADCAADRCFAVRASGNSLLGDSIENGDYLIIDSEAPFINGRIYIVLLGEDVVARHCWLVGNRMRLVASGGTYDDIEANQVTILGRVILSGKWQTH